MNKTSKSFELIKSNNELIESVKNQLNEIYRTQETVIADLQKAEKDYRAIVDNRGNIDFQTVYFRK